MYSVRLRAGFVKSFVPLCADANWRSSARYTARPVFVIVHAMPDYAAALNKAQYEAVTSPDRHTLVVAGAGSGKTRTIVYRLAWLAEQGVPPESILLLTFTRKAAHEMLARAQALLNRDLRSLPGGTFHSFAFSALRIYRPDWLEGRQFTLMDSADITQAVKQCRETIQAGKRDSSFPKTPTIANLLSKARNKEESIAAILERENQALRPYADALAEMGHTYAAYKRAHGLLDYDDLLFELDDLLARNETPAFILRNRFRHVLVDEYQDTNLVQARIVRQLAQSPDPDTSGASVMAVGDEAQSIYAFRGANMRNIMEFPEQFPAARVIRLEQNYRSTQPILDVANGILSKAQSSYHKHLFTQKEGGDLPRLIRPISDLTEAELVGRRITELLQTHKAHEIAVLLRAGFHSYALENVLRKNNIPFRKYGGLRFIEAAHVKDVFAFARLALNMRDLPAFSRVAQMHKGIGPKTVEKLHHVLLENKPEAIQKAFKRFPEFLADLEFIENLKERDLGPEQFFEELLAYYRPRLQTLYDDAHIREQGLEEIRKIAQGYENLDIMLSEIVLDSSDPDDDPAAENTLTLSTVHSAKGLEWNAVIILDAVEDRFPSRHSRVRPEDFEEERRLFYVACTRARQSLDIFAPTALYSQNSASPVGQSPFLQELPHGLFEVIPEKYAFPINVDATSQEQEVDSCSGIFAKGGAPLTASEGGHCRHRIFGRGKILKKLGDDRVQVNFPGFGVKVILADYLLPEE